MYPNENVCLGLVNPFVLYFIPDMVKLQFALLLFVSKRSHLFFVLLIFLFSNLENTY